MREAFQRIAAAFSAAKREPLSGHPMLGIVFRRHGDEDSAGLAHEDMFMAMRGHAILELPTGQGLVIKR